MSTIGTQLQELFTVFTEQLLAEVQLAKQEGIPIAAADKAAIIRFLQVNSITYTPQDDDELAKLRELLQQKGAARRTSALETLREANADIESLYNEGRLQ
jgi:tRNA A37 N6-isopentenylltransferase MiaA